jgi:hypothetical protein
MVLIRFFFNATNRLVGKAICIQQYQGMLHFSRGMLPLFVSLVCDSRSDEVNVTRYIGVARTNAYYAIVPFMGVLFSFLFLGECPSWMFFITLTIMEVGAYLASTDNTKEDKI